MLGDAPESTGPLSGESKTDHLKKHYDGKLDRANENSDQEEGQINGESALNGPLSANNNTDNIKTKYDGKGSLNPSGNEDALLL